MRDLSILIPARNEQFLAKTIEDILFNITADTEVITVCDGSWPDPPVEDHPRVTLIYRSQPIGQRAATNEAAKMSTAKFVMKCDAHCSFAKGFDTTLMGDCEDDWTVVPQMRNLHAFDWRCKGCGHQAYQGPYPAKCAQCDNTTDFEQVVVWQPRNHTRNNFMRFDSELHFQYWRQYKKRPEARGDLVETMSLLGACFMMRRQRYWELDGLDEQHGSWGQMGTEIACKTWLSGGRLICNKKTWFAHMFRTQTGFSFPYPNPGVHRARAHSNWLWKGNNWPKAKYPLSWLIDKFAPVPDWEQTKGIVYYTDNRLDESIKLAARNQLDRGINGHQIISVSLKPISFGKNITLDLERGYLTMFKQILAGLEANEEDIIFFCEHDVLYHPSHFDFIPSRKDVFYYNENIWKVDAKTGQALFYFARQTSGLCAYRSLLLEHYRKRVEIVERDGFSRKMGFEPGTHNRRERVDDYKSEAWMSKHPNIDIRHRQNLTPSRWRQDQFRNQKNCRGWTLADNIPGWGQTKGRFKNFLTEVSDGQLPMHKL
jgi:glycosyltransferase involved in cell wall biosynthesis